MRAIVLSMLIFFAFQSIAQPRIANTKTKVVSGKMLITYDILNSSPDDMFKIWVSVSANNGMLVNAKTLNGDIGDNVAGGIGKQIIWDMVSDSLRFANSFTVKVLGKPVKLAAKKEPMDNKFSGEKKEVVKTDSVIAKKTEVVNERPNVNPTVINNQQSNLKYVGTAKVMLMSAVFPGWGLSAMEPQQPYWIMGIVGYSCIGAGLYFNWEAASNYDSYLNSKEIGTRQGLANDWKRQDKMSKVFAGTAIGVWGVNLVWTAIKARKAKFYSVYNPPQQRFLIGCDYNYQFKQPQLCLHYTF